jgi:hypothetical protein
MREMKSLFENRDSHLSHLRVISQRLDVGHTAPTLHSLGLVKV